VRVEVRVESGQARERDGPKIDEDSESRRTLVQVQVDVDTR